MGPILGAIIGVWLYEGYLRLMKRYANLPNVVNIGSVELHEKVTPIDDDDQAMITHKHTTLQT